MDVIFDSTLIHHGRGVSRTCAFCLFAGAFILFFTACPGGGGSLPEIPMNWMPVDSINVRLPRGIRLFEGSNRSLPLRAWVVRVDEKRPRIRTRVVVSDDPADRRETVASFARDLGAVAVINGGYFTMRRSPADHVGLLIAGREIVAPATGDVVRDSVEYRTARGAVGFLGEDGIDITWAATRNDTVFSLPDPPGNHPGRPVTRIDFGSAEIWRVRDAVGAGPTLLEDGRVHIATDEEVFFGSSIPLTHPRTCAGIDRKGRLLMMVVDGRQPESRGVTLEELASLMRDFDAVEAVNLDGGGSSTLVVDGMLINRPAGGTVQREVMSAIATFYLGEGQVMK